MLVACQFSASTAELNLVGAVLCITPLSRKSHNTAFVSRRDSGTVLYTSCEEVARIDQTQSGQRDAYMSEKKELGALEWGSVNVPAGL